MHARKVAKAFNTEHHELVLKPDVVSIVEDLAWYLDEPFGDTSAIPTYMVSKLAAEHVKVVLTGDGGDELFAGYDKYVVERREREYDRVPAALRGFAGAIGDAMPEGMKGRRFLRHLALDGPKRYLDASTLFRMRRNGAAASRRARSSTCRGSIRGPIGCRICRTTATGCRPRSIATCTRICRSTS